MLCTIKGFFCSVKEMPTAWTSKWKWCYQSKSVVIIDIATSTGVNTELFPIAQGHSSIKVDKNSTEESSCEPDPVVSSNNVANWLVPTRRSLLSLGESPCTKRSCQWIKQRDQDVHHSIKSEQKSSRVPLQSQKEILADGSKSLSSSLIAGHSREAIVDINARTTRLLSGSRITTLSLLWAVWWSSK